jgi:molybdopterin molybdotransferase
MKSALRPVPAAEARRILAEAAGVAVTEAEQVPLAEAAGRVLAQALVASEDVPSFPRAVMDGYAVRAADAAAASGANPVWLTVVGTVAMGGPPLQAVGPGQAVGISTGGHLPPGADAVVMIEDTESHGAVVGVRRAVAAGRNVILVGEDIRRGTEVLPAGRRLGAADVAALAAFGQAQVSVRRRPRVAVLSSGSEICAPVAAPPPGKVRDVNQYALGAQAAAAGCQVSHQGIVDDDAAVLEKAVSAALANHDLVLLSGGSSVGRRDHTGPVFARLGEVLFHGINVRPGRPTVAARAGRKLLLGMPGVPTSAIVIFEVFVRPLLQRLGGERGGARWPVRARLDGDQASVVGREDYLRVRLVERAGETWAEVLPGGSAALSSVVAADGLVVVPEDVAALAAGDVVGVHLFR